MRKRFHLDDIFSRETGFVQKVTGKDRRKDWQAQRAGEKELGEGDIDRLGG